jgi:hypothetical protein
MRAFAFFGIFMFGLIAANSAYCAWLGWIGRDYSPVRNVFYDLSRALREGGE